MTPDRSVDRLAPMFYYPFMAWLAEASRRPEVGHVNFRPIETRRSAERQAYLWAQGREAPYLDKPKVTWVKESFHQWGLAADFAMFRKDTGEAIWTPESYAWLFRLVPPEPFGLRHLVPVEFVHLEHRYAGTAVREAADLGLYRS